jgi:hypothetical protein
MPCYRVRTYKSDLSGHEKYHQKVPDPEGPKAPDDLVGAVSRSVTFRPVFWRY